MNELTNNAVTMTSLEMIELINNSRKEDDAVLQHKNFLAKVPQVLGDEPAKILAGSSPSTCGTFARKFLC